MWHWDQNYNTWFQTLKMSQMRYLCSRTNRLLFMKNAAFYLKTHFPFSQHLPPPIKLFISVWGNWSLQRLINFFKVKSESGLEPGLSAVGDSSDKDFTEPKLPQRNLPWDTAGYFQNQTHNFKGAIFALAPGDDFWQSKISQALVSSYVKLR